jgi:hypothetical protein
MSVRTKIVTGAILAATLALPAGAQVAGTWRGVGLQAGPDGAQQTWDIVMTVRGDGAGEISYPSLGCTGRLTEVARSARETEFRETITSGPCIDGGRIAARPHEGRVFWFWSKPADQVDASAVLYRGDQVAILRTPAIAPLHHPTF